MPYANPVAAHVRVISHTGQYAETAAQERDCQAVTAALMAEPEMADVAFWFYRDPYKDGNGSMVLCDGVDPHVDGSAVDIWTYSGHCFSTMPPTTPVYVARDVLAVAGYSISA